MSDTRSIETSGLQVFEHLAGQIAAYLAQDIPIAEAA